MSWQDRWPHNMKEYRTFEQLRDYLRKQRPYRRYFTRYDKRRMRLVAPNTWLVLRSRSEITLTFHGTDILRYTPKYIQIDMARWGHSSTTRSRVSCGLRPLTSSSVWSHRGALVYWYTFRQQHSVVPYWVGMKVNYHGIPLPGRCVDNLRFYYGPTRRRTRKWEGYSGSRCASIYATIGFGVDQLTTRIA